ncbi:UDP-N-acetylmuramoyl-L-alanyl-D-glutamate--2,6-diaminopimelate ligase [Candidatus Persebacteraceae bacterium Df01]|jgi:UDP-N-acetylmuramoyl-L-alanyl-D-glutamate--2,6-diaminopimelate ligase|uniref:UDP-N-acetylmuramoyl-L-alanyl-D-glutamate--2,6-diaminopimelate ligase n=1 Tax=Candidatus Doriopsillibacter californiensis TaxID=2970740 RepID=A0ABT7QKN3_9GAMM|nr:UDP-N-acetylmuramoyl-L-alanyl-D-glutamate--2,6-diaminopimelate ligase [Candidatus Persebacteraceae bacterium Df01]
MFDAAATVHKMGAPLTALSCDSHHIPPNAAFVAYPGDKADGRDYIPQAIQAGAAGIFWDPADFSWSETWHTPHVAVPELRSRTGLLANFVYNEPSQKMFTAAITGTNGKTTIAHLAALLMSHSGRRTAVVGTLGAYLPGEIPQPTGNTTPEAIALQAFLQSFCQAGAEAAMIEASSHGIVQGRLAGVQLEAAVFANAGRDHLDYHGDIESYHRSKAQLFESSGLPLAILNADDEYCAQLAPQLAAAGKRVLTYGRRGTALRLLALQSDADGQTLELDGDDGWRRVWLPFAGAHNAHNFMAAALLARAGGGSWASFSTAVPTLPEGRLQRINNGGNTAQPAIYVDYAHTPDALTAALAALRQHGNRLWLVCGCGGERDRGKRALMGKVAATADVGIVTDDNPRDEEPAAIRADVLAGGGGRLQEIAGRGEAITWVITQAAATDTILIAGKGHENYQDIAGKRHYFSDADTAQTALKKRNGTC